MQFTRRVQYCTAEKSLQRNLDVEMQQYVTMQEILTPSPEISTELLHQSDLYLRMNFSLSTLNLKHPQCEQRTCSELVLA